ncbi:transcriptional regulator [Methylobacterium durans]|uniref:transcriptional regulator n=1 Tax=Methylobacterium durans TaxID=2202825 RepID=UPI001F176E1A|nr:transcriptional regulator [Methylobacterium durans]
MTRIAFVDFEASSLGKRSYPIEVAWVFGTGEAESFLIRPAPGWTDWAPEAEAVHRIPRPRLLAEGTAHDWVALHMLTVLRGAELYASAPSWDGQWLSRLLRAAGLPRHALRLRDTGEAQRRAVVQILRAGGAAADRVGGLADGILAAVERDAAGAGPPAHRALADARGELERWRDARRRAEAALPEARVDPAGS